MQLSVLKELKEWWDGLDDELDLIHQDHRNRQQRRHPGLTIKGGRHTLKYTAQRGGSIKVHSGR